MLSPVECSLVTKASERAHRDFLRRAFSRSNHPNSNLVIEIGRGITVHPFQKTPLYRRKPPLDVGRYFVHPAEPLNHAAVIFVHSLEPASSSLYSKNARRDVLAYRFFRFHNALALYRVGHRPQEPSDKPSCVTCPPVYPSTIQLRAGESLPKYTPEELKSTIGEFWRTLYTDPYLSSPAKGSSTACSRVR